MFSLTLCYLQGSYLDINLETELIDLCARKRINYNKQLLEPSNQTGKNNPEPRLYVTIGPYRLNYPFSVSEVELAINAAAKLQGENRYMQESTKPQNQEKRFHSWISENYVWVITVFLSLYLGLSFLAPLLESRGYSNFAKPIYGFYRLLCHQLAYRSYFIGGEQSYYPRALANLDIQLTYETATGADATDLIFARNYLGSERLGYKLALCQRDIAIYGSMIIFGLIFQVTGRKMKSLPWYLLVIFGLGPIAMDGLSQLPGLAAGWPSWLPSRESTPLLRSITGALFGVCTMWFLYPLMEESMAINKKRINTPCER